MCLADIGRITVVAPRAAVICGYSSEDRAHPSVIINSLRPRQNERHFPDDSLNSIKISLKFVPKGPIHNIP